jgi:hypothetical protein
MFDVWCLFGDALDDLPRQQLVLAAIAIVHFMIRAPLTPPFRGDG